MDNAFVKGQTQLAFYQERAGASVSSQEATRSGREVASRELDSRYEKSLSLPDRAMTSEASVLKLTFIYDTLCFEATVHTSEVATLQARPSVISSGPSHLDYDAAARKCDHFASLFRSFWDRTSCFDDNFAYLCHQTRAS